MKRTTNTTTNHRSKLRLARMQVRVLIEGDLEQAAGGDCTDHNCPCHPCGITASRYCAW